MQDILYRASFYLYELSFIVFGFALVFAGQGYRKINQALHHPPVWLVLMIAGVLLWGCAVDHFIVYHFLSPQYLLKQSHELLISMYIFKTISMASIFIAGLSLLFSFGWYWKKITE